MDVPNHPSSVVFMSGCNFNCGFCHNHLLINHDEGGDVKINDIARMLNDILLADVVSFTGGEPLLQVNELFKLMKMIPLKKISVDTNGLFPDALDKVVQLPNMMRVAIDLKGTFENYPAICETSLSSSIIKERIKKSIKIVLTRGKILEIRTTFSPSYISRQDLTKMCSFLETCGFNGIYVIQSFRSMGVRCPEKFQEANIDGVKEIASSLNKAFPSFTISTR